MAIEVMDYGLAAGLGILDQFLEHEDNTATIPRKGWARWSNMARLGVAVGGISIVQMMPRYARYAHPLAIGATTLLAKALAKEYGGLTFAEPGSVAGGTRTVRVPQEKAAPAQYSRSYMPEFDLTRTL